MTTTAKAMTTDRRARLTAPALAALTLLALTLIAASPGRASLVVRADIGPVRVVYADPQPACIRVAPPVVGRCASVPAARPSIRVCAVSGRHAHRWIWVPGHYERARGHRAHWVEGRYVCRMKPAKHYGDRGAVIVKCDGGRCDRDCRQDDDHRGRDRDRYDDRWDD